jgi:hypothetical protein
LPESGAGVDQRMSSVAVGVEPGSQHGLDRQQRQPPVPVQVHAEHATRVTVEYLGADRPQEAGRRRCDHCTCPLPSSPSPSR